MLYCIYIVRNGRVKKFLLLVILFISFFNICYVNAADLSSAVNYNIFDTKFDLSSKNVILYNLTDNYMVYENGSKDRVQVASLTKIMTTIVGIENIDNLDKEVTIDSKVFSGISEYSKAGFKVGNKVTYRDLLYGIMLPSGADAARALFLNVSGSEEKFVELMNNKVKELKLSNTKFDNTIGMDSDNNYSTASDMAAILNYALSNEEFRKIFTTKVYTVPSLNLTMHSTLDKYGKGIDTSMIEGVKSGYTDGAGVCLASIAKVNNVEYLLIVLGADSNDRSNAVKDSVYVYDFLKKNYEYRILLDKGKAVKKIGIKWGKDKYYAIKSDKDIKVYIKNTVKDDEIEYVYNGIDELNYKIKMGDKLGNIEIKYKDNVLVSQDVFLDKDIKYYHPVIYGIIGFSILLMLLSLMLMLKKNKRKKRRRK